MGRISDEFEAEKLRSMKMMHQDSNFVNQSDEWFLNSVKNKYSYNFTWLGRPIIQYPQDVLALQEIIWKVKPDLIIETGVAHGGSIVFHASMLELLGGEREVWGIDIDIRQHNRQEIEAHPLFNKIKLIEGSSISKEVAKTVAEGARKFKKTMVILDSNHTHEHVYQELLLYSGLVQKDSYLIVYDTVIENIPKSFFPDRPWGPGNSPQTAIVEFMKNNHRFEVDSFYDQKLLITAAPGGYLRCKEDENI